MPLCGRKPSYNLASVLCCFMFCVVVFCYFYIISNLQKNCTTRIRSFRVPVTQILQLFMFCPVFFIILSFSIHKADKYYMHIIFLNYLIVGGIFTKYFSVYFPTSTLSSTILIYQNQEILWYNILLLSNSL